MRSNVIPIRARNINKESFSATATDLENYDQDIQTIGNYQIYLELANISKKQDLLLERHIQNTSTYIVQQDSIQNTTTNPKIILINKLALFWELSNLEICILLGFDKADMDYVSDILAGLQMPLGRDFKDRILLLYDIRKSLNALFRDIKTENKWLRETCSALDDKSPLEFMLSGRLSDILFLKQHIDTISGY